jgi:hypothetical protein
VWRHKTVKFVRVKLGVAGGEGVSISSSGDSGDSDCSVNLN